MNITRILPLLAMLLGSSGMAQVYKCTDSRGQISYTATACGKDAVQQQTIKITPPATPRANSVAPARRNWEAENEAFRLRHAERQAAAEAELARPPVASVPATDPPNPPRHFIRRQNQASGK